MRVTAVLLQILAWLGAIGGVIVGFGQMDNYRTPGLWIAIVGGSLIGGCITFGLGAALDAIADIREDSRQSALANARTAVAIELLLSRRQPKPEPEPEPVMQPPVEIPQKSDEPTTPQRESTLQMLRKRTRQS